MVEIGSKAPDFTLMGDDGKEYTLSSFAGRKVLLYFYPKDNTPGCTKEACSLRDWKDNLSEKGVTVVGVSRDSEKSHKGFREKHSLNFILLSDPEKSAHVSYSCWGEKKLYGKVSMGAIRKSFLIGEDGTLLHVWNKVNTANHGEEVSSFLDKA